MYHRVGALGIHWCQLKLKGFATSPSEPSPPTPLPPPSFPPTRGGGDRTKPFIHGEGSKELLVPLLPGLGEGALGMRALAGTSCVNRLPGLVFTLS